MNQEAKTDESPAESFEPTAEVDMFDVLAKRVHAGQAIFVSGELDDEEAKAHANLVNRLMRVTKMAVRVLHFPAPEAST